MKKCIGIISIFLAMLSLVGCSNNVLDPEFEPEISNETDTFEFQATDVKNVTQTVEYDWENTGTLANINLSSSIAAGTASLTVKDSGNNIVYQKDLKENGSFVSNAGIAGNWRIILNLSEFDGTLNFRLEKRTP